MINYFKQIFIGLYTVLKGMAVTWHYLFQKPYTLQYPEEPCQPTERFRGVHTYKKDECIACNLCVKACPVNCIKLEFTRTNEPHPSGKGKKVDIKKYEIDYSVCIWCGLCSEACPTNCLAMGKEYNLATITKEELKKDLANILKAN